ncbi:MAG: type II toxin-antitoxin system CcdA family antitoxin [Campylobacterota bacterium]|nr:type II toxin-antitoxin system CcdA family antitoxin [Campylobacterota bacterium]
MIATYNKKAPKKPTSLTINSDLLKKAKSYKINLSQNFEYFLTDLIKKREEERWKEENRDAIEDYNQKIGKNGTFSDGVRSF